MDRKKQFFNFSQVLKINVWSETMTRSTHLILSENCVTYITGNINFFLVERNESSQIKNNYHNRRKYT